MSVTLLPLPLDTPLRIEVSGTQPARDAGIEQDWAQACKDNPRLFDGPILTVDAFDAGRGVLSASPERYAHLVCQPPGRITPTTILSVTGVIESTNGGWPSVLLAQRGHETRGYPGMWEFAPAGGLHVPQSPITLGLQDILGTLRAELAEEVGITQRLHDTKAIALVADHDARSVDIIVRGRLDGEAPKPSILGTHAWESAQARWIGLETLAAFLESAPGGAIEPTLVIARFLGWSL